MQHVLLHAISRVATCPVKQSRQTDLTRYSNYYKKITTTALFMKAARASIDRLETTARVAADSGSFSSRNRHPRVFKEKMVRFAFDRVGTGLDKNHKCQDLSS